MSAEHGKIREELSAYLDGELGEPEAGRVEEALKADSNLAAELDSLRAVREMVRRLPRQEAPAGMAERVIARAERAIPRASGRGTSWARRVGVAAAALVAVGIGAALLTLVGTPRAQESKLARAPDPGAAGRSAALDGKHPVEPGKPATLDVDGAEASIVPLNFVINTDNLAQAQLDVEGVFRSNSLLLVAEDRAPAKTGFLAKVRARANVYSQTASTSTQIRYEVVIAEDQVRQIVDQLNAIRSRQKVAQIPMRDALLGVGQAELAMAERPGEANGDVAGKRILRKLRGPVNERFAGGPAEKTLTDAESKRVGDEIAMAYKAHPAAQPAPASRPAGATVGDSVVAAKDMSEAPSREKGSEGLFGVLYSKAKARPELADKRERQRTDVYAFRRAIAKSGPKAAPATRPAAAGGDRSKALDEASLKRYLRMADVRAPRQRGQATTFARANVRQLVVILNGVRARGTDR